MYLYCLHIVIGSQKVTDRKKKKQQEKQETIAEKSVWKMLSTSDVSYASSVTEGNQGLPIQPWERGILLVRRRREAHSSASVQALHSYPGRLAA